ncbi:ribonuclease III [Pajaroellobacter abortibovis]|uniref:Ribonuclease 3 n=1 Tax=Pajaroellobacter abortibovis TaxID=1882918 RepID=A0A1L6MZX9_9BACT|nr:ribonuclease III [Pajaroellobacter abortibovis]
MTGVEAIPLFEQALTHPSYAHETHVQDNQRLEFLGDAILGFCVSEFLVQRHPEANEGLLTRMRAALINSEALAAWARLVDLEPCIALGRGAALESRPLQINVLADVVEALVAAVYDAGGLEGARAFVHEIIAEHMQDPTRLVLLDPKSALQEKVQAHGLPAPTYTTVATRGPQHDRLFIVEVKIGDVAYGRGEGRSKKIAERAAALAAAAHFQPPEQLGDTPLPVS